MPQELRTAVADAVSKAETCSVETERLGRVSAYADLTAARETEQILPGRSQPACTRERPPNAFVDSIPGTTIYICPVFFGRPASDMSLTIMHEGLHLAGVHHTDFGDDTAPHDPGPMNDEIKRACGYQQ